MPFTQASQQQIKNWNNLLKNFPSSHFLQSNHWAHFKNSGPWKSLFYIHEDTQTPILIFKRYIPFLNKSFLYLPKISLPLIQDRKKYVQEFIHFLCGQLCVEQKSFHVKTEWEVIQDIESFAQSSQKAFPSYIKEEKSFPQLENVLLENGFFQSLHNPQFKKTMWIDLDRTENDLMQSFKSKTRYNIRLAQKKGVIVEEVTSPEALNEFYLLHQETGKRGSFPVRKWKYYESLWKTLVKDKVGTLLLARHEGDLLGGVYLFHFQDRVYYQYGASSPQKRNLMANYLLQWEAMLWAQKKKARIYDMVGLPEEETKDNPFSGVARFKRGFQGDIITFFGSYNYYVSPRYEQLWKTLYPYYKRWLWYVKKEVFF